MKRPDQEPLIHETAITTNCTFGRYCELMAGCYLNEELDDYSYCAAHADIWCTRVGKFSNIAAMTRINPGNHPMDRASLHHFMCRSAQYWLDQSDDETFFDWRRQQGVEIGHDTWLGHGAIILAGRTVGRWKRSDRSEDLSCSPQTYLPFAPNGQHGTKAASLVKNGH